MLASVAAGRVKVSSKGRQRECASGTESCADGEVKIVDGCARAMLAVVVTRMGVHVPRYPSWELQMI